LRKIPIILEENSRDSIEGNGGWVAILSKSASTSWMKATFRFQMHMWFKNNRACFEGRLTYKTKSTWPLHFKHSHWRKRRNQPKFATHNTWGTDRISECKMDVKLYMDSCMTSNGSCFMITWTIFPKPHVGGRPNTKPWDHGTPNAHNRYFILYSSCVRTRMDRNSWKKHLVENPVTYGFTLHLRVRDHTTWFWRYVGDDGLWTLLFWAPTISWSRLLACVWSGP
jgi:hypothetical protein